MSRAFYEFSCPVKIVAGHAALEHIPFELSMLAASKPMILTDKGVRSAGLLRHLTEVLAASGMATPTVFDDVPPDSSLETVQRAAACCQSNRCDSILAVGGGSVIDTAKAT
ncbi:MAG: iron-containing alcohol dehydrogenase, partial [Usitatibacteraceae bacterium]